MIKRLVEVLGLFIFLSDSSFQQTPGNFESDADDPKLAPITDIPQDQELYQSLQINRSSIFYIASGHADSTEKSILKVNLDVEGGNAGVENVASTGNYFSVRANGIYLTNNGKCSVGGERGIGFFDCDSGVRDPILADQTEEVYLQGPIPDTDLHFFCHFNPPKFHVINIITGETKNSDDAGSTNNLPPQTTEGLLRNETPFILFSGTTRSPYRIDYTTLKVESEIVKPASGVFVPEFATGYEAIDRIFDMRTVRISRGFTFDKFFWTNSYGWAYEANDVEMFGINDYELGEGYIVMLQAHLGSKFFIWGELNPFIINVNSPPSPPTLMSANGAI